ncbi:MAG: TfoX/Sxy family protein [Chromatiales bacterium]|nr:TfoX/Sxy family protein [Chromatiales bacterium]
MSAKAADEFTRYLLDQLQAIGPVSGRRMFGGYGFFLDGMMFALVADQTLYLKADDDSRSRFEAEGLTQFVYERKGKPATMSYYQAPPESLESRDILADWANLAFAAALRAGAKKGSPRRG